MYIAHFVTYSVTWRSGACKKLPRAAREAACRSSHLHILFTTSQAIHHLSHPTCCTPQGAYFLGKALYTKGYRELFDALKEYDARHGLDLPGEIDTYCSGGEFEAIVAEVDAVGLPVRVNKGIDHAHPSIHGYRVFVNPSTSDGARRALGSRCSPLECTGVGSGR